MKNIFVALLLMLIGTSYAIAKSSYVFDVNINSKEVTIIKDDVVIQGEQHNVDNAMALFRVTKEKGQIHIDLCSIGTTDMRNLPSCIVSKDGTVRIAGISIKIEAATIAFKEAEKYLDDTDLPIYVFLYE